MLFAHSEVSRETNIPDTVGAARGRIHIIARYKDASVGLPCYEGWRDDTTFALGDVFVQDNYCVSDTAEKMDDIRRTFAVATEGTHALVLNYTSCYIDPSFPPIYAGLPAHKINRDVVDILSDEYADAPLGVLVCDFITSELSDAIIGRNFR